MQNWRNCATLSYSVERFGHENTAYFIFNFAKVNETCRWAHVSETSNLITLLNKYVMEYIITDFNLNHFPSDLKIELDSYLGAL